MKKIYCVFAAAFFATTVLAQEALKSTEEEYYDFLSLQGLAERPTLGYRTLSDSEWTITDDNKATDENIWKNNNLGSKQTIFEPSQKTDNLFTRGIEQSVKVKIYGPEWYNSYNTAAPYGQNDGALWQGKGYNTSLTGGARLEGYGVELTFKPQVSFSQNVEFDLMPSVVPNEYGYFQGGIDMPQRFGDSSFCTYDWGDSEVRYSWHSLTLGAGFQSPWLGPAWLNPMLGSNNAPSYLKVDAGLRKTEIFMPFFGWDLGAIEGRVWLGKLEESDYFDENDDNDYRLLTAISASYAPSFIPGLSLGVNRIFITDWAAHNLKYIARLFTLSKTNGSQVGTHEDEDQKVALFADWNFPKVGFEAYGELGIDDFSNHFTANPFRTVIYSIGVKKSTAFPVGQLKGELIAEWNNFEMSRDFLFQRNSYIGYYGHGSILQGYTSKGQIIGAGSGSLGNSQFLGYKVYHPSGNVMIFFNRYCPNNNFVYSQSATSNDYDSYSSYYAAFKTYCVYGVNATQYFSPNFFIAPSFSFIDITNEDYDSKDKTGMAFSVLAKYVF